MTCNKNNCNTSFSSKLCSIAVPSRASNADPSRNALSPRLGIRGPDAAPQKRSKMSALRQIPKWVGRCSPKAQTAQGSTIFHCGLHCGRGGSFSRTLRGWRGRWNKAPQWRPQGSAQFSFVVPSWVFIAVHRGSKMEKQHVWMNAFFNPYMGLY